MMSSAIYPWGHRCCQIRQRGLGLVQTVLALLVFTGAMAAGIQLLVRWGQQSRGELQARQLLVVQAAVQRFIMAHQAALSVSAADAPFVPYVDANGDGVADAITYTTLAGQNYGQLNLPGAVAGTPQTLARAITGLPTGVAFSWSFDTSVLQNTPLAWLKPGKYAVLDGLTDPVAITLSIDQSTHRIRGLACLNGTAIRDGEVDVRALQAVLAYRAPASEAGTSAQLAVSINGQLRSATGPIDLNRMRVAFPGAPTGPVPDGKVCAMVGDWPSAMTAGLPTPQRITSGNIASTSHYCAYPGEMRWIYNTTTPPLVQGLQLCGSNYNWLPPAQVADNCLSADIYTDLGRDSLNKQPVHLQCSSGKSWEQRQTLRVAKVGDACTATGDVETHAVDSNGKILYCLQLTSKLSDNPFPPLGQTNVTVDTGSAGSWSLYYIPTSQAGKGKDAIGCVPWNPSCVHGLDMEAGMHCTPVGGIFIYDYYALASSVLRFGICILNASGEREIQIKDLIR